MLFCWQRWESTVQRLLCVSPTLTAIFCHAHGNERGRILRSFRFLPDVACGFLYRINHMIHRMRKQFAGNDLLKAKNNYNASNFFL